MSANKVLFGLEKVHIAFLDPEAVQQPAWETPKPIEGAVGFSPNPEGEEVKFYADNTEYFTATSNNGYSGDLEMALIPDDILAEMLGWEIDSNGMLVEVADGIQKPFALMGQIQGDRKNRRFVYYNCTASRPTKEHSTKSGTIEPNTDTLSLKMLPLSINEKLIVKGVMELSDTNVTAYNAFFSSVTKPAVGGGA